MGIWRIAALVAVLSVLAGCSHIKSFLYQDYGVGAITSDQAKKQSDLMTTLVSQDCFATAITDANGKCQAERNLAMAAIVVASEQLCTEHRKTIYGNDAGYNIVLGTLTNFFAGAAAIVDSERRKAILAALALFMNSERSLINESVYKSTINVAVDKKIVEIRIAKLQALKANFSKPITSYPVGVAEMDVMDLHYSCSFMHGLNKALEEGSGTLQKIARLRGNLSAAEAELRKPLSGAAKTAAEDRYKAISTELQSLEMQ
jgi:hypothetical protein